jgi:hypothetical protein
MSAVVPVPVGMVAEAVPASAFTVAEPDVTEVTTLAFVAEITTLLPAVRLDSAIRRVSAESTLLSDGTGRATAVAEEVPAVAGAEPATVSAVVAALAGPARITDPISATAEAIAIRGFLIEVIFSPLFYFLIYIKSNLCK